MCCDWGSTSLTVVRGDIAADATHRTSRGPEYEGEAKTGVADSSKRAAAALARCPCMRPAAEAYVETHENQRPELASGPLAEARAARVLGTVVAAGTSGSPAAGPGRLGA